MPSTRGATNGGSAGVECASDLSVVGEIQEDGGGALIRKSRGRTSNNRLIPGIREYVIELVRSRYADFGA
jgi:hypothetical protein